MNGLQIEMILVALAYSLLTGVIAFLIARYATTNSRNTERRVKDIVGAGIGTEKVLQKKKKGMKFNLRSSKADGKDGYKSKKSVFSKIGDALLEELLAANIMMNPEEFAAIWIAIAFIPGALLSLFVSNVFIPVVFVVLGVFGPILYLKFKKRKRTMAFEAQLSDALMIAASSIRSGLSFQQAMETISRDMYPPVSEEFSRAVKEINMGYSVEDALDNIYRRVSSEDFKIAAVAISVQRTTGGNLSEILGTIADTIKERAQLKNEVRSATATGRMSGLVVGLMPVAITVILNMMSPGYMDPLFSSSGGKVAIGVGIALELIGLIVIKKITTIKY